MYSVNNQTFDAVHGAGFGVIGYLFLKLECEPAPLLLGFVLGPMMEENLRRSLLLSRGDFTVFVTRPLSMGLLDCRCRTGGRGGTAVDQGQARGSVPGGIALRGALLSNTGFCRAHNASFRGASCTPFSGLSKATAPMITPSLDRVVSRLYILKLVQASPSTVFSLMERLRERGIDKNIRALRPFCAA